MKDKLRLGVLASGTGTNLQAIIDASCSGRIDAIVGVVISDRKGATALDRARASTIPALTIEREEFPRKDSFEEAVAAALKEHGVELVCLAGYMRIVGKTLLKEFPGRVINIHPALLPSFPGLDAQGQAFDWGVKISGCTVHFVDEEVDHGPIICQAAVEVKEDDMAETLRQRILEQEHRIYPMAIQMIANGMVSIKGRKVVIKKGDER